MYLILKRVMDLVLSLIALILISPVFLIVIPILKCTGEREIFFIQKRIGKQNRSFGLLKFATMLKDSPKTGTVTAKNDPRILPMGKFLRKAKINELPQILNVIKGDMSIVGFRPLTNEGFQYYSSKVKKTILQMKPGLTGMGSIIFRNEEEILFNSKKEKMKCYKEDIIPLKGDLESWYFNNRNIWIDIKIIMATALIIILPQVKFYQHWFPIKPLLEKSTLKKYFI